jgi:hypothetical protein
MFWYKYVYPKYTVDILATCIFIEIFESTNRDVFLRVYPIGRFAIISFNSIILLSPIPLYCGGSKNISVSSQNMLKRIRLIRGTSGTPMRPPPSSRKRTGRGTSNGYGMSWMPRPGISSPVR